MTAVDPRHKHPSTFTDAELVRLLRAEKVAVAREMCAAKREIRAKVAQLETLRVRLHHIEDSENYLGGS